MKKPHSLRTIAWVLAVLLVIGVACWWQLGPRPSAAVEADSAVPNKTRVRKRSASTDDGPESRRDRDGADAAGKNTLGALYDKQHPLHKPTKEELEPYLKSRHRSVPSLLAAWQITGDLEFVREAATKDAADPRVLLALAANESTPEARRKALAAFRQAFPKNALGDYLLATAEFQDGNRDAALDALHAATAKPDFERPKAELHDELEAAYLTTGSDPLVARALAVADDSARSGKPLYQLVNVLGALRDPEQQDDPDAALAYAKIGLRLAERFRQGSSMLDQTAGAAMEAAVLRPLAPETEVGPAGVAAAQRLADGQAIRDEIRVLTAKAPQAATLSAQDAYHYLDISQTKGDFAALRWLKQTLDERGQK